jgi:hypothetical protein
MDPETSHPRYELAPVHTLHGVLETLYGERQTAEHVSLYRKRLVEAIIQSKNTDHNAKQSTKRGVLESERVHIERFNRLILLGYLYTCQKENLQAGTDAILQGRFTWLYNIGNQLDQLVQKKRVSITNQNKKEVYTTTTEKIQQDIEVATAAKTYTVAGILNSLNDSPTTFQNTELKEWIRRHKDTSWNCESPAEVARSLMVLKEQQLILDFANSLGIEAATLKDWHHMEETEHYTSYTAIGVLEIVVACTVLNTLFRVQSPSRVTTPKATKAKLCKNLRYYRNPSYRAPKSQERDGDEEQKQKELKREVLCVLEPSFHQQLMQTAATCFPEYAIQAQRELEYALDYWLKHAQRDKQGHIIPHTLNLPLKKSDMNPLEKLNVFGDSKKMAEPYIIQDTTDEILAFSSQDFLKLLVECPVVQAWVEFVLRPDPPEQKAKLIKRMAAAKLEEGKRLAVQITIAIASLEPALYPSYSRNDTIEETLLENKFLPLQDTRKGGNKCYSAQLIAALPKKLQAEISSHLEHIKERTMLEIIEEWFTSMPIQRSYQSGDNQSQVLQPQLWHWYYVPEKYVQSPVYGRGTGKAGIIENGKALPERSNYLGHGPDGVIQQHIELLWKHHQDPWMAVWYLVQNIRTVEWKFMLLQFGWRRVQPQILQAIETLVPEDVLDTAFLTLFEGPALHVFNRGSLNKLLPEQYQLPIDENKNEHTEVIVDYHWNNLVSDEKAGPELYIPGLWEPIAGIFKMFSVSTQQKLARCIVGLGTTTIAEQLHKGNDEDFTILRQLTQRQFHPEDIPFVKAIMSVPNHQQHHLIASTLSSSFRPLQCEALESFATADAAVIALLIISKDFDSTQTKWKDIGVHKGGGAIKLPEPYAWMNAPLNTHPGIKSIMAKQAATVPSPFVKNFQLHL